MVPAVTEQTKKMGWSEPAKDTGFKSARIGNLVSSQVFEPSMGAYKTVWTKIESIDNQSGEAKPE